MEELTESRLYSFQEYLELEKETDIKYEYWNGEIFAMAGSSRNHNSIAINLAGFLSNRLAAAGCKTFVEGVKLELQSKNYYVYPDVMMTCSDEDNDPFYVKTPTLIAEVLSPATEIYDRTVKLAQYRKIKSLKYYLLISQFAPYAEIYGRSNVNDLFTYNVAEGAEAVLDLTALNMIIPLTELYRYVAFEPLP